MGREIMKKPTAEEILTATDPYRQAEDDESVWYLWGYLAGVQEALGDPPRKPSNLDAYNMGMRDAKADFDDNP